MKHRTRDGARTAPRTHAPPAGRNGRSTVTMRSSGVVWMKEAEKGGIVRALDACATIKETRVDPA
ncbi:MULTISPECIES: hypothetical protein [Burkholderia]|uniref:hypothetical protein n=1 Tax=Burkholderia TaxID=32008 RepID=UPI00158157F7|nr:MULTISPECIES: hypothetical protein [Burkholderia]